MADPLEVETVWLWRLTAVWLVSVEESLTNLTLYVNISWPSVVWISWWLVRLKHVMHRPMSPCLGVSHMVQAFPEQERTACLHLLLLEAQSEGQEIVIRAEWGTLRRCRLDFFMTTFPLRCHSEFLTLGWSHLLGWLTQDVADDTRRSLLDLCYGVSM